MHRRFDGAPKMTQLVNPYTTIPPKMETNLGQSNEPLLSRSIQQENYNTFTHEEEDGREASRTASNNDQHEQEVSLGPATEQGIQTFRPNERGNGGKNALQRMTQFLKSNKLLKYTAIGFGLWSELGCWTLVLVIPIAILSFSAEYSIGINNRECCFESVHGYMDCTPRGDLNPMALLIVEVPSYLMMVYCIRRLRKQPKALPLARVFTLATKTKSVNFILLVSIAMIVTSMLVRECFPIPPSGYTYGRSWDIFGEHRQFSPYFVVWRLLHSVVIWQAVVSCLVFGEVMKALAALVDQCYDRMILATSGNSLNDFIELHQELCCTIETTFSAFKKWFLVNTFGYVVLICWVVIEVFSIFGTNFYDFVFTTVCFKPLDDEGDGIVGLVLINIYYFLTLLLYAFFVCYYPWHSTSSLKNSLNHLVQKLNCKIDWSSEHVLKNRSSLNDFIQYMKNAEHCSLMKFTFREKIPYISILLAVCGLLLTVYTRLHDDNNHNRGIYPSSRLYNASASIK